MRLDLTEDQKQVLRNMYLLRFMKVYKDSYVKYTLDNSINFDNVNILIEIGLIKYDSVLYSLHPLLEDLIKIDLHPNSNNCVGVYSIVDSKIYNTINYDGYGDADEYEFESNCGYLCAFFKHIDLENSNNMSLLLNWLLGIFENENVRVGEADDVRFSPLYDKLLFLCNSKEITPIEKYNIYYIVLLSWMTYTEAFFEFFININRKQSFYIVKTIAISTRLMIAFTEHIVNKLLLLIRHNIPPSLCKTV